MLEYLLACLQFGTSERVAIAFVLNYFRKSRLRPLAAFVGIPYAQCCGLGAEILNGTFAHPAD